MGRAKLKQLADDRMTILGQHNVLHIPPHFYLSIGNYDITYLDRP